MSFLLSLLTPRALLAMGISVLLGFSHYFIFKSGKAIVRAEWDHKTLEDSAKARQTEANWQTNLEAQNELDQEERARMRADYDSGLERLRSRASQRLPQAAASACAGASPEQLSGPDAAAFERLARDARAVQLDLEKARQWIETVTKP